MTNDALIEEINSVYRRLSAAAEALVRADRELAEHVRRVLPGQRRGYPGGQEREDGEPLPRRPARHRRASPPTGRPGEGGTRPPARKARGRAAAPDR